MTWFEATQESEGVVDADRATVWQVLTDPDALAELTPFLERIEPAGDLWRWHFGSVPLVGQRFTPCFTERMTFREPERIDYRHAPPTPDAERAGVDGWYTLTEVAEGTHLAIGLTIKVHLPLPRVAAPAVHAGMRAVIARTGAGFEQNFERRLEQLAA
jgi:carbon monoxide dehydrogenase subunit G